MNEYTVSPEVLRSLKAGLPRRRPAFPKFKPWGGRRRPRPATPCMPWASATGGPPCCDSAAGANPEKIAKLSQIKNHYAYRHLVHENRFHICQI